MSEKLSCMIADFLVKENAISEKDYAVYKYGLELMVYGLEQSILLLVLGALMKQLWITAVFLAVFTSLRRYTGGYHANTRVGCTVATVAFYMAVLVLVVLIQDFIYRSGIVVFYILFYWIVFFRYVPVEHKDKPMSDGQKKRNKGKALILSVVYIIIIALLIYPYSDIVGYGIVVTMFITAVSVMIRGKGGVREMIKKVVEKLLVKLADNMTEKAVNSASPRFCFQPEEPEAARVKFLK